MAGYIITMSDEESLKKCVETGLYSTILSDPKNSNWMTHHEGTFADYFSMKEGDSIYFFCKRKIYGIGRIVNIGNDCKYLNYEDADIPEVYSDEQYKNRKPLLVDGDYHNRCFCAFEPSPYFFKQSIDMDEALSSNPEKFRMLRTMWKVSFIKIDDEEDKALQDVILKRNEYCLETGEDVFSFNGNDQKRIEKNIETVHRLTTYNLLLNAKDGTKIKHEMAIEAALCSILGKDNNTVFGKWDYVSHQVAASPFKPVDYMDKMDIFGYRYIKGYKTISKYLVIELKKDEATIDVVDQVMKYVDWINQEYSHGDYSMIEAYIVAADFSDNVIDKKKTTCIRNFTKGYRPSEACTWTNCKLIKYEYANGELVFEEIVEK